MGVAIKKEILIAVINNAENLLVKMSQKSLDKLFEENNITLESEHRDISAVVNKFISKSISDLTNEIYEDFIVNLTKD